MFLDDFLKVIKKMNGLLLEQIWAYAMLVNGDQKQSRRYECAYP